MNLKNERNNFYEPVPPMIPIFNLKSIFFVEKSKLFFF